MKVNRQVVKTHAGYRVYGAFSCIMDVANDGNVTYSNVNEGNNEYVAMFKAYKKAIRLG
jgi:hypothetical protein